MNPQKVEILGEYRCPEKIIFAERTQSIGYRLHTYTFYKNKTALVKAFNALVPNSRKMK